ncbi:MAG: hypothetical protein U0992_12325 [Planctomycetaceae bacterium]
MVSKSFALFLRALRVDVRLLHSHLMRLALLFFVTVTLLWTTFIGTVMGAPGLWFFIQLTTINAVFATLSGPLLFATCITEEKEEQTLGLLRMANVGPFSILLGKLAPRLTSALLVLAVQFPFTLLAITLGGVTWQQVIEVFVTLLAHTFLIGTIALFCSVVGRRTASAVGLAVALILIHVLLPAIAYTFFLNTVPPTSALSDPDPKIQWFVRWHAWGIDVARDWYYATATGKLYQILTTGYEGMFLNAQVVSNVGGGLAIFLLSWLLFDVFNRDIDVATAGASRTLSDLFRRRGRRSLRAWDYAPIVGREFRFGVAGYSAWIVKLLAYGPGCMAAQLLVEDGDYQRVTRADYGEMIMIMMAYVVMPIESVVLASRVFRSEIKERTWSTLMMLPRSLTDIAYSKVVGAALALLPGFAWFVIGSIMSPQTLPDFFSDVNRLETIVVVAFILANYVVFVHLVTWFSLLMSSWFGILVAFLTWFAGLWLWYLCLVTPLMLRIITPGPDDSYMLLMNSMASCALLAIAAVLHFGIGSRLRAAAAA